MAAHKKVQPMKLLTDAQRAQLMANGKAQATVKGTPQEHDFFPVVKLFTSDGGCTWLLSEIDPDYPDIAWGVADLGMDCTEFGTISLSEIEQVRGRLGLPVERDLHFKATKPISAYLREAARIGRLVA